MVYDIMNDSQRKLFEETHDIDFSFEMGETARFRVNVFLQRKGAGAVFRTIPTKILTLEQLGMPPILKQICDKEKGLVLVTGPTGSGKSTTLAGMIDHLNNSFEGHILTVEDPIEFVHQSKKCLVNQRELGPHTHSFANALRAALREDPDIILVGEMRDLETIQLALTVAETGHLVFSTLHTINAGQTINRILGMFSKEEEKQVRERLAETLRYIVSQRLVAKVGGGRLLVTEIMGSSLRTRESLIYGEGENRTFLEIIEAGDIHGWHSFDQSLLKAYEAADITDETAVLFATHKTKMRRDIEMMNKMRYDYAEESSGLQMATDQ